MSDPINDYALDTIFGQRARVMAGRASRFPETLIRATYDLAKMGSTSANCSPARFSSSIPRGQGTPEATPDGG